MNRNTVNVEILEWMIGYYMILAVFLTSLVLPLFFLIPLFFVWRLVATKKIGSVNLLAEGRMSKSIARRSKLAWNSFFLLVCIVLMVLMCLYKLYVEYYWLTHIAVPGASIVGKILGGFFGFIGSIFSFLFSPMERAYESASEIVFACDIGLSEQGFAYFWSQYVTIPVYNLFTKIGDFFSGIGEFIGVLHKIWLGKVYNIGVKHELGKGLSVIARFLIMFK